MTHFNWFEFYKETKATLALFETIIVTGAGFLLGNWFLPEEPFFAVQGFTWLMIGPLLSGLRYGFGYSLSSVLFIIALLLIARSYQLPWVNGSIPLMGLALLMIAFVTGEFSNYWKRRIKKLEASVRYLNQNLNQTDNTFNILEKSHQRLEQLIVSQSSLRDSILAMREQFMNAKLEHDNLVELGPIILRVLSDHGAIQEASLYAVNKDQSSNSKPISSLWNPVSLDLTDPLVCEAMTTKKTIAIKKQLVDEQGYSGSVLLAIPLADVFGNLWGIITVSKIPFRCYCPENIKMISILAGYMGDLLAQKISPVFSEVRDEKLRVFLQEVQRCILNVEDYSISSTLISLEFTNQQNVATMKKLILNNKRCLDQSWEGLSQRGNQVLILLLPMTTRTLVDSYNTRLEQLLKECFQVQNFQAAGISFHLHELLPTDEAIQAVYSMTTQLRIVNPSPVNLVTQKNYATIA